MAQATTLSPVEDIRSVADTLAELREIVPDEFTALDYLAGKLFGVAEELEAREVRP
jgi:DNA polymerase III epsilon subunit-like protein